VCDDEQRISLLHTRGSTVYNDSTPLLERKQKHTQQSFNKCKESIAPPSKNPTSDSPCLLHQQPNLGILSSRPWTPTHLFHHRRCAGLTPLYIPIAAIQCITLISATQRNNVDQSTHVEDGVIPCADLFEPKMETAQTVKTQTLSGLPRSRGQIATILTMCQFV
jgi:hypothetical protein